MCLLMVRLQVIILSDACLADGLCLVLTYGPAMVQFIFVSFLVTKDAYAAMTGRSMPTTELA